MKLIDSDCCDLRVGRSAKARMVSGVRTIRGHLKFDIANHAQNVGGT